MALVDRSTGLRVEALQKVRAELLEDLKGLRSELNDAPGASVERSARGLTIRALVDDLLEAVGTAPLPSERGSLVDQINLLYDVALVAAEYYKLFIRAPTLARPAGRI